MEDTGTDYPRGNHAALVDKQATHKLSTWFIKGRSCAT
jgi:hypothetical protein